MGAFCAVSWRRQPVRTLLFRLIFRSELFGSSVLHHAECYWTRWHCVSQLSQVYVNSDGSVIIYWHGNHIGIVLWRFGQDMTTFATIRFTTFWIFSIHRLYVTYAYSLTQLCSPLMKQCEERLSCGCRFTTLRCFRLTSRGIISPILVVRHFGRDMVHCDHQFNDIAVARQFHRLGTFCSTRHLTFSCFS